MNREDFTENIIKRTFDEIYELNRTKGRDYASDENAIGNFSRHAENLGLTPEQVWGVYASKHWDAIMTYCKRGVVQSEAIEGRIDDAILYLLLLKGLVFQKQLDMM